MQDSFSRVIDYLRLSITDRCNLRCLYCMPSEGVLPLQHGDILSYEEIIRIVEIAARLGVKKVRLTGGEPLTRRNITFLISSIKKIPGIEDLSMTTNGLLLEKYAQEIAEAGLDRVNVSIDSFKPERYREITRKGSLETVKSGLVAAEKAGLKPIKINMVPIRGLNDDEIMDFARLTLTTEYHVRFIECMPSGDIDFWSPDRYITTDELKHAIEAISPLTPVRMRKHGPSKYYRLSGAKGVIGFISALTHHFCEDCNRLRLTADGKLRPCLFSETEIDLKSSLRSGAPDEEIERLLMLSIQIKPEGHSLGGEKESRFLSMKGNMMPETAHSPEKRPMSRIGG
ncbi:MAG: GTP 3',8-cyclase MoaA [Nitrospirae bacterium]|nr:GTP 3',8-cyclase MoaA [Nitrospirota bacterium]